MDNHKDLEYLKSQRKLYFDRLEQENDNIKRTTLEARIDEIDQKIKQNDLSYWKEREKLLKKRLDDDDDFEFNNKINTIDSKNLEEKIDHSLEEFHKVTESVEKEAKGKDKNEISDQNGANVVETVKNYEEKKESLEKEKNIRETEYKNLNDELEKKEDEIFKTDLDAQRGKKDVEITENRISDFDNLEKRLSKTIDNKTSDSKNKEKEALQLQAEIKTMNEETEAKETEIQSKNVLIELQEEKLDNEEKNKISLESQLNGAKNKRILAHSTGLVSLGIGIASIIYLNPVLAIVAIQGALTYLNTILDISQLISELEKKIEKANRNLKTYQQFIDQKKLEKENLERDKTENKKKKAEREKAVAALMAGDDEIKKAILNFKQQLQNNSSELDLKKGELKLKQESLSKLKEKHEKLEAERNDKKSELDNIESKIVENNKSAGESLGNL